MTATEHPTGTVRTAHASGLGAVARELGDLHRSMLRAGDTGDAVRLSVMTLVVACTGAEEAERAGSVVAAISSEHPARALLVLAQPDGDPGITADLRLECGVGGRAAGVCAELVHLRVGGAAALHLGSVVGPLLLPDVPVHLWIPGAPRLDQALSSDTLRLCERVIVDSGAFADTAATLTRLTAAAGDGVATPIVDLAWLRLRPWRELVARAFDAPARRRLLAGVDGVEVRGGGAAARLTGGWLASRLGLETTAVTLGAGEPAAPLALIRVHSGGAVDATVTVERDADGLRTDVMVGGHRVATRSVPLDEPELAELVGAALQDSGADPAYAAAARAGALLA